MDRVLNHFDDSLVIQRCCGGCRRRLVFVVVVPFVWLVVLVHLDRPF